MKTYKIYLNIYDFMGCNGCLEAIGLGAYHTGVQIGNNQYCYSVVSDDPNETGVMEIDPQSAQYIFNRKIYLGQATIMNYRLSQIIQQLSEQYTCGKYHMFSNNCNHFSNQLSKRLTNVELPKWVFRSTNILTYLCCCLPDRWVNGQLAYESLMEQEKKAQKQQEKQMLIKK